MKAGAAVIAPNGKPFTEEAIGMTLATRNLMDSLPSAGEITSGPKPFALVRPLGVSIGAGSGHRAACARGFWI